MSPTRNSIHVTWTRATDGNYSVPRNIKVRSVPGARAASPVVSIGGMPSGGMGGRPSGGIWKDTIGEVTRSESWTSTNAVSPGLTVGCLIYETTRPIVGRVVERSTRLKVGRLLYTTTRPTVGRISNEIRLSDV